MPGQQQPSLAALYGKRLLQAAAVLAALFAIYTEGANAYLNTQEAIRFRAVTVNAALRQKAEAELAEQQTRIQLETARNAFEQQRAEADKAEAEAKKAEADAVTLGQQARNAELKARSEADTIRYQAEINRNKALTELETARFAARQFKAQADAAEQNNLLQAQALQMVMHDFALERCPGADAAGKIQAKEEGRC